MDAGFISAQREIGACYIQEQQFRQAIAECRKALTLHGADTFALGFLGQAYALAGEKSEAIRILEDLKARAKREYVSPYGIAMVAVGLRDKDQAFEWLQRGYEERVGWMGYIRVNPALDPLRSDPRFHDLLRRMNLAEESARE